MRIFSAFKDSASIALSRLSRPFSRLFVVSDGSPWVLREEAREMAALGTALEIPTTMIDPPRLSAAQCFHFTSQFTFSDKRFRNVSRRASVDVFHGSSLINPHFSELVDSLRKFQGDMLRIRVSTMKVKEWLLAENIPAKMLSYIPIGIRTDLFAPASSEQRASVRASLEIPDKASVIGSFQKDGVGWGAGMEPKFIKGPDIFLRAIELLKPKVSNLFVLLSGPARGYVKQGLERLAIPYRHTYPKNYRDIARLYHALDAYVVSSRDEGGPKSVLEAMASGVPLVTTRVGQAADLVQHGTNGFMTEQEDAARLAQWTEHVLHLEEGTRGALITAGRQTAEENSYESQIPLWRTFFDGYIVK